MATSYLRADNIKVGQSVVAAAAYRSGEKLVDQQYGRVKNYKGKTTEVVFDKIYLPSQAPVEFYSKENLWNAAQWAELNTKPGEDGERTLRAGARFAKAYTIAIPNEFSIAQEKAAMEKVAAFFTSQGYGVQIDIHHPNIQKKNAKNKSKVKSKDNHHAHLLVTARKINSTGFDLTAPKQKKDYVYVLDKDGNKVPELDKNGKPKLNQRKQPVYKRVPLLDENGNQRYRERKGKGREPLWATQTIEVNWLDDAQTLANFKDCWAEICNQALEQKKISFHTHEKIAETKDLKPEFRLQPQIHVGAAAWGMMQKGIANERAIANENIKAENNEKLSILGINYEQWEQQAEDPDLQMYKYDTAVSTLQDKQSAAADEKSQAENSLHEELVNFAKRIPSIKRDMGIYKTKAAAKKEELYEEYLTADKMLKDWNNEHKNKFAAFFGFKFVVGDPEELDEKAQVEKIQKEASDAYHNYDISAAEEELYFADLRQSSYAICDAKNKQNSEPLVNHIALEVSFMPDLENQPEYIKSKTVADKCREIIADNNKILAALADSSYNLEAYERLYLIRKAPKQPKTCSEYYLTYAKRQLDKKADKINDEKVISDILAENGFHLKDTQKTMGSFATAILKHSPNYIEQPTDGIKEKVIAIVQKVYQKFMPDDKPKQPKQQIDTWEFYNNSLKEKKEQTQTHNQNQPHKYTGR